MNEMSVREWQKRFLAGDFSSRDLRVDGCFLQRRNQPAGRLSVNTGFKQLQRPLVHGSGMRFVFEQDSRNVRRIVRIHSAGDEILPGEFIVSLFLREPGVSTPCRLCRLPLEPLGVGGNGSGPLPRIRGGEGQAVPG